MAASRRDIPHLLRLPLELRHQIYRFLLPRENVSHPLPSVGITSVSHRPPSSSLLNIHPILTDEILDYFYTISTWKLVFSHAFNFFRVDPDLRRLEQSPSLDCIRRVEVVFFCDELLLQQYPSFGLERFCEEIRRRAERACEVLGRARRLTSVVVSWCDSTETGAWEEKARILTPLKKLNEARTSPCSRGGAEGDRIVFRIGKITGPKDLEREDFVQALREVLGDENKRLLVDEESGRGKRPDKEEESSLRMLAFDMRQERHMISSKPGGYPWPTGVGRSGWKGAPPALAVPRETEEEDGQ